MGSTNKASFEEASVLLYAHGARVVYKSGEKRLAGCASGRESRRCQIVRCTNAFIGPLLDLSKFCGAATQACNGAGLGHSTWLKLHFST